MINQLFDQLPENFKNQDSPGMAFYSFTISSKCASVLS